LAKAGKIFYLIHGLKPVAIQKNYFQTNTSLAELPPALAGG
jgi:hypothetical protein